MALRLVPPGVDGLRGCADGVVGRNRDSLAAGNALLDLGRRRQGFSSFEDLNATVIEMPDDHADFVEFLFWTGWRADEARDLEWTTYDRATRQFRLRDRDTKERTGRVLSVNSGKLREIINRRLAKRRLDCRFVF